VNPAPHPQAPSLQVLLGPQERPQAPQFTGSVCRSEQVWLTIEPQTANPLGQKATQIPSRHVSPVGHAVPQPPQFAGSPLMLAQYGPASEEHSCWLWGQEVGAGVQAPPSQRSPAAQTCPQLPQLKKSR
jgi:hypothetical protein